MKSRKSLIISALAVLLSSTYSFGQDGFSAGAKVLGNVNKFAATEVAFGYGAGGFATMPIVGPLSVRGELLYVSYAGGMQDTTRELNVGNIQTVAQTNRNLRFHSLEVPVMAVVNLPFLESLNPKISVGYAFSYNFGVYQVSDNSYAVDQGDGTTKNYDYTNTTENVTSEFQPYNSSVLGSLSFNFERIHVDFRYQQGFPNLSQNTSEVSQSRYLGDFKTQTISVSIGYRFL